MQMTIIFKMRKQFKQNSSKIEMVRDFWQKFTCSSNVSGILKETALKLLVMYSSLIKARANNRVLDS